MIGKKTVPLGVVAIIYESRPNVTADAFGLCFKSANACILRGGSDSVNSNIAIVNVITDVLKGLGIDPDQLHPAGQIPSGAHVGRRRYAQRPQRHRLRNGHCHGTV